MGPVAILGALPLSVFHRARLMGVVEAMYGRLITTAAAESAARCPGILEIGAPAAPSTRPKGWLSPIDSELFDLARETPGAVLVVEDRYVRAAGGLRGIRCSGVLGVLLQAKAEGRIPALAPLLPALEAAGLRISPRARNAAIALAKEGGAGNKPER